MSAEALSGFAPAIPVASPNVTFLGAEPFPCPPEPTSHAEGIKVHRQGLRMIGRLASASVLVVLAVASTTQIANAGMRYDGAWDLNFVTQRGACDRSYDFQVRVTNGVVSHPMLVRFTGHVSASGAVRASVTAGDKFASGSGRLTQMTGHGTWSGYSGSARCSGYWTAARS